jgi:hypothetical protein
MGGTGGFPLQNPATYRQARSNAHGRIPSFVRDALSAQLSAIPWALLAAGVAASLLAAGAYVLAVTGQPLSVLVRDANAIAQQPNYFGALEHAEILLMCGAGWIALYTSLFCRGQTARFLFLGGLLSLLLATDDLYMLHESSHRFQVPEQFRIRALRRAPAPVGRYQSPPVPQIFLLPARRGPGLVRDRHRDRRDPLHAVRLTLGIRGLL